MKKFRYIFILLSVVITVLGFGELIGTIDIMPNYISWSLLIIGIVLLIATNFISKQKPDQ